MECLIVIPARGGSKGIPHKNIKELCGRPLICYSIDVARKFTSDENICVTTDDDQIIKIVEDYGLKVPFKRPDYLATDTAGSSDVIKHAYEFFEAQGKKYDVLILLQPTSPFRKVEFIREAVALYDDTLDQVVSVQEAASNPYYNCFEEDSDGFLVMSKTLQNKLVRRQDAPKAWEYNGSIYVINPKSLKEKCLGGFTKKKKFVMDKFYSIDLDTLFDWKVAEMLLTEKLVEI